MAVDSTNLSARERKALDLISQGAVALIPGARYAIVKGTGQARYRVNKDGCECADWQKRGEQVGPCKHMLAARTLCAVYRMAEHSARRHGRTRLPAALARALAAGTAEQKRVDDLLAELHNPSELAAD